MTTQRHCKKCIVTEAHKQSRQCHVSALPDEYPSPPPVPQVVDSLDVSAHGTRVGLVQYSSRVRTEFPLNMYHSADEIKAAVMKVKLPLSAYKLPAVLGFHTRRITDYWCTGTTVQHSQNEANTST